MLTHVVLFTIPDPADAAEAKKRLDSLVGKVPSLLSLQTGLHVGADPDAATLALITTHEDLAGLKAYNEHPDHVEVAQFIKPRRTGRVVVDHES